MFVLQDGQLQVGDHILAIHKESLVGASYNQVSTSSTIAIDTDSHQVISCRVAVMINTSHMTNSLFARLMQ